MGRKKIKIEYDFDMQSKLKRKIGAIMGATRQYDMVCACRTKKYQMIEIAFGV